MPVSVITDSILNIKGEVETKEGEESRGGENRENRGAKYKSRYRMGTERKNNTIQRIKERDSDRSKRKRE